MRHLRPSALFLLVMPLALSAPVLAGGLPRLPKDRPLP